MEQPLKEAMGLGRPEIVPEPQPKPEPEPTVTIYDFSSLLAQNEPPKRRR